MSNSNFKGPFIFKKDESGHGYVIRKEKEERFNELMYGAPEDFEWAEDRHDLNSKFMDEFGAGPRGLPNIEFYLKDED